MPPIIKVTDLSKSYILNHEGTERYTALRDVVTNKAKKLFSFPKNLSTTKQLNSSTTEEFWALKDINFEIEQGDRVGIIGRNGAGKSTLLKILSRITEPTKGRIELNGRVASLLEVGTGFHPELTGRENIFLNGAILGMSRAEIKRKFDEIVDFAEVERFLDTPVKRYSSGMYVRLAFAVAAHLEPEILIVDEVLAVGDAQFQKKCLGKMEDVSKNEGRTVLFVSHNISAVKRLTNNIIYLDKGKIQSVGKSLNMIDLYLNNSIKYSSENVNINNYRRSSRNPLASLDAISINNSSEYFPKIPIFSDILLLFLIDAYDVLCSTVINCLIKNSQGEIITSISSGDLGIYFDLKKGSNQIQLNINNNIFSPGKYFIVFGIGPSTEGKAFDVIVDYPIFEIFNDGNITGWLDREYGTFISKNINWLQNNE